MPDIQMTRQTNLRGTALQNAVNAMLAAMGRRAPFNAPGITITPRWESATRLTFVGNHYSSQVATGSIVITDGRPSTVSAEVTLYGLARLQQGAVESAMVEESDRALQPIAGSAATSTQTPAQTPAQTSTQTQRPAVSSADRWAQWGIASNILGDLFGGAAAGLDAYNQQMGYTVAQEAVQIASQEAQRAGVGKGAAVSAPPPRASVVQRQPPAPPVQAPGTSMTTVGWVVIGAVGLGVVGLLIAVAAKKSKQNKKDKD
jgi:hypothetical protein